jgi:hypothetical protein
MEQADRSVRSLGGCLAYNQNAEAGTVDVRNFLQIEDEPDAAFRDSSLNGILKNGRFFAENKATFQPKNCEAFCYFGIYLESHASSLTILAA